MSDSSGRDEWVRRVLGVDVGAGSQAAPGGLSLVKLAKARLAWRNDRMRAAAEIGRLRGALRQEYADDPEQAQALAAATARLGRLIAQLDGALDGSLDAILNESEPSRRAALRQSVRASLARADALVAGDEIMVELDRNDILPDMVVVEPLRRRLAEVGAALG